MDEETKRALRKVVEYLIDDEEANWNEMDQPDDHICFEPPVEGRSAFWRHPLIKEQNSGLPHDAAPPDDDRKTRLESSPAICGCM